MFEYILIFVTIAAAWDTLRRYADAYHNRARLSCVEDVAHEAMTKAEDLDSSLRGWMKAKAAQADCLIELERRLDVQSKALAAQGETLIDHGRKLSALAVSKLK